MRTLELLHHRLEIERGDIVEQQVDAIVNAANAGLRGGGGVDGAIHRAGGGTLMEETARLYPSGCPTGSAVITNAGGSLKCRHVIHAVGPIWRGGNHGEDALLHDAYLASLKLAEEAGLESVAFPSISTGAYSFPVDRAAAIALEAAAGHLRRAGASVRLIRFVLFDQATYEAYERELGHASEEATATS